MSRKPLSFTFTLLFATLVMLLTTNPALAAGRSKNDLRGAVTYVQLCEIPYNINDYGYQTGLHFVTDWDSTITITLRFYCGGEPYATNTISVPPEGLTGTAQSFLPAGVGLKFPTLIFAYWNYPGSNYDGEHFWVTQFLFTGSGFSHQTFTSHDY